MNFKKMETTHRGLFLEVDLGRVCNFRCSYCPPDLHNGKEWINYDHLKKFIEEIKPAHVLLGGGEPTKYPMISDLLKVLKDDMNVVVDITSNGSKPLEWWVNHTKYIDILTLTYHIEFTNKKEFIEKIASLTNNRIITINLPMIPERFDECYQIGKELSTIKNTFVSLKALTNSEIGCLYKYTDEQLSIMSEVLKSKIKTTSNKHNIDFYGITEENERKKLTAQKLISYELNSFFGWKCWKGIQYLRLAYNGDLYRSACELGGEPFSSIYDSKPKYQKEPTICNKEKCFCLVDLKCIDKEKI